MANIFTCLSTVQSYACWLYVFKVHGYLHGKEVENEDIFWLFSRIFGFLNVKLLDDWSAPLLFTSFGIREVPRELPHINHLNVLHSNGWKSQEKFQNPLIFWPSASHESNYCLETHLCGRNQLHYEELDEIFFMSRDRITEFFTQFGASAWTILDIFAPGRLILNVFACRPSLRLGYNSRNCWKLPEQIRK